MLLKQIGLPKSEGGVSLFSVMIDLSTECLESGDNSDPTRARVSIVLFY